MRIEAMNRPSRQSILPAEPTGFVGRQGALQTLEELVERSQLVTVTGPPGVGKTRLAVEFGRLCMDQDAFAGGVVWCDVSECADARDVRVELAAALDVSLQGADEQAAIAGHLAERERSLIIVDNFEHVVDTGPKTLGAWLSQAPQIHVVVTSRESLRLVGEQRMELEPLASADARALFVERARAARHDFEPTADSGEVLGELVGRLDALPLAIELAAARVGAFAPPQILERLDDRFRLLRSAQRDRGHRQATLHAAIDWSWQLLDDVEREVLGQMTVFCGGLSLDAAEAVLEGGPNVWIPDVIDSLRNKSLLRSEVGAEGSGQSRFRLFESVREFVIQAGPKLDGVRERHASHYIETGRRLVEQLNADQARRHLARLRRERANLRAIVERFDDERAVDAAAILDALMRLVGPPERHAALLDEAVDLAATLDVGRRVEMLGRRADFATIGSDFDQAADDLDAAVALAEDDDLDEQLVWLLVRRGEVYRLTGDPLAAVDALEKARDVGDDKVGRVALAHEACCWVDVGDFDRARSCIEQLQRLPESDDRRRECELCRRIAYVQFYLENVPEQRRLTERALRFARELGDRRVEAVCLQSLGDCGMAAGDYEDAIDAYGEALELHRALANRTWEAILLGNLGGALHRCERFEEARRHYTQSLEYHRVAGTRPYEGVVLFALGALEFEQGHYDEARYHFEAAHAVAVQLDNRSDEAGLRLCRAWTDLAQDRPAEAAEHADEAEQIFADLGPEDIGWVGASLATRATIAARRGEEVDALLQRARECVAGRGVDSQATIVALLEAFISIVTDDDADLGAALSAAVAELAERFFKPDAKRSIVQTSLHARLVAALVKRMRGLAAAPRSETEPAPHAALVVGPECNWFRVDEERVDLRRRKSIRLVLQHLVGRHDDEPGEGTGVHDLFDIGWPGETVAPDAGARRVYWAIRTLRKNGLDDMLLTSDDGYLLDPNLSVARTEQE